MHPSPGTDRVQARIGVGRRISFYQIINFSISHLFTSMVDHEVAAQGQIPTEYCWRSCPINPVQTLLSQQCESIPNMKITKARLSNSSSADADVGTYEILRHSTTHQWGSIVDTVWPVIWPLLTVLMAWETQDARVTFPSSCLWLYIVKD